MKHNNFFLSALFCVLFLGIALTWIGCMSSGYMRVSANIGDQPGWGPTGYDYVSYYYIPDIDCYYSVSEHHYIYWDGAVWIHSATLPASYHYDPYYSYKVVVTGNRPYENHASHVTQYRKYRGVRNQQMIRDSRNPKYFENREHPEHTRWEKERHKNRQ